MAFSPFICAASQNLHGLVGFLTMFDEDDAEGEEDGLERCFRIVWLLPSLSLWCDLTPMFTLAVIHKRLN